MEYCGYLVLIPAPTSSNRSPQYSLPLAGLMGFYENMFIIPSFIGCGALFEVKGYIVFEDYNGKSAHISPPQFFIKTFKQ
jgi:hypothetical protein